jgi:hypothetical protein
MNLSLTQCTQAALQALNVLDSGETPSAQQLTDSLAAANLLLENWAAEQQRIINTINLNFPIAAISLTQNAILVFADNTTPIAFPVGWGRAFQLVLAIELSSQYGVAPPPALPGQVAKAMAAACPLLAKLANIGAPFGSAVAAGTPA